MSYEFVSVLTEYGYLAIFILVFLQEAGMPGFIPNEFLLLFSGYLIFSGTLYFPMVLLSAVAGDLLAGSILYTVFYFFGQTILRRKPSWLPFPQKRIDKISLKIQTSGHTGIMIGRLSPFVRGWVSVLSGLLHFSPEKYGLTLLFTSTIWVSFYVSIGYLIAPYFNILSLKNSNLLFVPAAIGATVIVVIIVVNLVKKRLSTAN
jgi:membrane protein DedA with SNARE-associated domain